MSTPFGQRPHLLALTHAAENDGRPQGQAAAIGAEPLIDLQGELARRRQDQGMRTPRRTLQALHRKTVQDGQREGRGLARARLGDAEQVPAFDEKRNRLRLNWRRLQIVLVLERQAQGLGEAEAVERSKCHLKYPCGPRTPFMSDAVVVGLCAESHALPGVRR